MMSRFLWVYICLLVAGVFCDDVEISEDEPVLPSSPNSDDVPSDEMLYKGSPDISVLINFVTPLLGLRESTRPVSLVAGKPASLLISLENIANSNSYSLYALEAALHYPRYFGYHIQNFTTQRLQTTLESKQQSTLFYTFIPAAQLAGQHFDLVTVLTYQDQKGKLYYHSLFNETISLLEDEEGANVELMFLGVMVVAAVILTMIFVWNRIHSKTTKRANGNSANGTFTGHEYLAKKDAAATERSNGNAKRRQSKKQ